MISAFDLQDLYKTYFNKQTYYIAPKSEDKTKVEPILYTGIPENMRPKGSIDYSIVNKQPFNKVVLGRDIWFPIKFQVDKDLFLEIDVCTIGVNISKTVIQTAVSERKGTVHEQFAIDDYKFTINGFLIAKGNFAFPETEILKLTEISESITQVELHGGYPEMFLDKSCAVDILTLDFPPVEGKNPRVRPFTLTCISNFIQNLIID